MAAIHDPEEVIDLGQLAEGIKKQLPTFARPLFVRLVMQLDITGDILKCIHLICPTINKFYLQARLSCERLTFRGKASIPRSSRTSCFFSTQRLGPMKLSVLNSSIALSLVPSDSRRLSSNNKTYLTKVAIL
jgi:hypothetical protein